LITRNLLDEGYIAEFTAGGLLRARSRRAAVDVIACGHLEMRLDFLL
jgi:hypothetical protein